jgi:8-oxo-dGTP pyrophosphatase MutT (NUDIX family)
MSEELLSNPDIARLALTLAEHPGRAITPDETSRWAAIALVLRAGPGGAPELLMIKRAEAEQDPWSGHVACPGGRMDPGDHDLAQTAIRETWEETGIDLARDGRVLGTLDDITPRTPRLPPLIIRPFVAIVRADVTLVESEEVADVFWVPVTAIRTKSSWGRGMVDIRTVGQREVDVFRHGSHVVWGLTHRALTQFVEYLGEIADE